MKFEHYTYLDSHAASVNRYDSSTSAVFKPEEEIPESWRRIYFKSYPRFPQIDLPVAPREASVSIDDAMTSRRSNRNFSSNNPMTLAQVSRLLTGLKITACDGPTEYASRRAYPSAGARYPTESYLLPLNVQGLGSAVYHYHARSHRLANLWTFKEEDLRACFPYELWWQNAGLGIVLTASHKRAQVKYGERAYRFCLLEAGHAAQNLSLLAYAEELTSCALGGYDDEPLMRLLDVNPNDEFPVHVMFFGKGVIEEAAPKD